MEIDESPQRQAVHRKRRAKKNGSSHPQMLPAPTRRARTTVIPPNPPLPVKSLAGVPPAVNGHDPAPPRAPYEPKIDRLWRLIESVDLSWLDIEFGGYLTLNFTLAERFQTPFHPAPGEFRIRIAYRGRVAKLGLQMAMQPWVEGRTLFTRTDLHPQVVAWGKEAPADLLVLLSRLSQPVSREAKKFKQERSFTPTSARPAVRF